MEEEGLFRWFFVGIFVTTFFISGYFRRKAWKSGDVIPRAREGKRSLLLRRIFATPFYLSLIAYMVNPSWMDWSSLSLPTWLRWLGVLLGLGTPPVVYWVVSTLGKNISETVFTREHHELVMHGPYRWVRHPLYAVATVIFVSLGIVAANWFFIGMAIVIIIFVRLVLIPKEEAHLIEKFGAEYDEYKKRTGMLSPRLGLFS